MLNNALQNNNLINTCIVFFSLEGCKSAWGNVSDMYNHLTTSKMKHNRNYLNKFYGIGQLTINVIFKKSRELFDKEIEDNKGEIKVEIKQVMNLKKYMEIKNRPRDWTEKKAKRSREVPKSDLTHYKLPTMYEKVTHTFEVINKLQSQMQLILESLQNLSTTPEIIWQSAINQLKRCLSQCDTMLDIFSRHTYLLTTRSMRYEKLL